MASTPTRKPEMRQDPVSNRWVLFSPARSKRPTDFKSKSPQQPSNNPTNSTCPFCIGHEHECAPEIFRVPSSDPEWRIRVIQNLYPALSRNVDIGEVEDREAGRVMAGFGFHDVVIEAPVHEVQLVDMEAGKIGEVLMAYKKRIEQIMGFDHVKYVQVFKNHGASAGASLSHSHSQILALPVIPPLVSARLDGTREYFDRTGDCYLCKVRVEESLIDESTHFISMVPFAATFPFEIWIIPRNHSSHFHELDHDKAVDLGGLLKLMLKKINLQLNNPPYNFMIQTSPLKVKESQLPYTHWFLQIVPQLTVVGGSEMGSGCYINPVLPEEAAKVLREVILPKEA